MIVSAGQLLNLALDSILIQLHVLGAPVNLKTSLEEALLAVKCHHCA